MAFLCTSTIRSWTFLKNFRRLSRLILSNVFFFLFYLKYLYCCIDKSKCRLGGIWLSAKLHVLFSIRSIQLQLWKAIQLSRMGFLVFLQRQEHHSLCNQACPKVVGSEYNLHLPLEYHQNCLRTAVNKLTNVNFSKNQIIRMRIILGKLGCFKTLAFLKVLSMNTPLV